MTPPVMRRGVLVLGDVFIRADSVLTVSAAKEGQVRIRLSSGAELYLSDVGTSEQVAAALWNMADAGYREPASTRVDA